MHRHLIKLIDTGIRRLGAVRARPAGLGCLVAAACLGLGFGLTLWNTPARTGKPIGFETVHLRAGDAQSFMGMGRLGLGRLEYVLDRIDDASDSCLKAGTFDRRSARTAELSELFTILSNSPTARDLLDRAWRNDVYVCADGNTGLLAYYLSGLRLIGLNPALTQGQKLAFLAHELSHMPQHPLYSDNRYFPPENLVLLRRVREAAAEACATQIASELKQAGLPAAWNAKFADRFYGDIARAYAEKLGQNASEQDEPAAMRAAFDQWFAASARINLYDRMTIDHLERISGDNLGLVEPRRSLSHGFLRGIGYMARWNYLEAPTGRLLTDPFYAGRISGDNAGLLEQLLQGTGEDPETPRDAATGRAPFGPTAG